MNDMKMKKQLMRLLGCAAFVLVLLCIGTLINTIVFYSKKLRR